MSKEIDKTDLRQRDREAVALHAIEGITFNADENALFAKFEHEGWSDEQIRAYLRSQLDNSSDTIAAE